MIAMVANARGPKYPDTGNTGLLSYKNRIMVWGRYLLLGAYLRSLGC